ncbi:MAG: DUF2868 domain-containing protein [Desulfuromonadaceae bacterium]|nr:DUF2868 domain-containing protein [Desulfuromonas sp.]MDY0185731.1 DUF2868 domain-containing protein [Desulfuromonadaceae bacterium]
MKPNWKLTDVVDLEYFLATDEHLRQQAGEQALHQRDRVIFLARQQEFEGVSGTRGLLRCWLAARRTEYLGRSAGQALRALPGEVWAETATLTHWLVLILGLISGATLSASLLAYSGTAAVNVSGYFALFILLQAIFLILQLLFFVFRSFGRSGIRASILCKLGASLLNKLFSRLLRRSQRGTGGEARLNFHATLGQLKQNRQEYGSLYFWPAFILLQIFGVSFNLGVLTLTLIKVSIADVAFGWQTTLQVDPTFLAETLRLIATPWSWFVPAHLAYPTLEQIEGSKIVLKEGIYHLATGNLAAWWPFLTLGVLTYGLLPRLLLLFVGVLQTRRSLRRLSFDSARFRQLRQRMLTPTLQTSATNSMVRPPDSTEARQVSPLQDNPPIPAALLEQGPKLLLIPDELWDELDRAQLTPLLLPHEGNGPFHPVRIGALDQSEEQLFTEVAEQLHATAATGIVLLQEGWQPPIREIMALLRRLRHEIPRRYPISVTLIGKPTSATLLTPAKSGDLKIWHKTLQRLADPYLAVISLVSGK